MFQGMPTAAYRALYTIAEDQMGYLTTAQASAVGISSMALVMMSRRGTLERVSRGVYRLVAFPGNPLARYMRATLWPSGRRGVLSHETALSLHGLSDIAPETVHITVPADFRVQREIPGYLVVHRAKLASDDVARLEKMPVTTPVRTIRDCIRVPVGAIVISRAIKTAHHAGVLDAATSAALDLELRSSLAGENW